MVVHPACHPHGPDAQRSIQQLRPQVGKSIAPPVQRHCTAGTAQHYKAKAYQREHQHQKRQVHGWQMPQRQAALCMGSSFVHPYHLRSFIVRGGGVG